MGRLAGEAGGGEGLVAGKVVAVEPEEGGGAVVGGLAWMEMEEGEGMDASRGATGGGREGDGGSCLALEGQVASMAAVLGMEAAAPTPAVAAEGMVEGVTTGVGGLGVEGAVAEVPAGAGGAACEGEEGAGWVATRWAASTGLGLGAESASPACACSTRSSGPPWGLQTAAGRPRDWLRVRGPAGVEEEGEAVAAPWTEGAAVPEGVVAERNVEGEMLDGPLALGGARGAALEEG